MEDDDQCCDAWLLEHCLSQADFDGHDAPVCWAGLSPFDDVGSLEEAASTGGRQESDVAHPSPRSEDCQ